MPRVRRKKAHQYMCDFVRGWIIPYWDCGLSYCFSCCLRSRDCLQNMESMGSRGYTGISVYCYHKQPRTQTSYPHRLNRLYSHITSSESKMGQFARQKVPVQKVILKCYITDKEYPQWWTRMQEWHGMFSDKSPFCLEHHDGPIHVWWPYIWHPQGSPSHGLMVWSAIECISQLPLVHIDYNLKQWPLHFCYVKACGSSFYLSLAKCCVSVG